MSMLDYKDVPFIEGKIISGSKLSQLLREELKEEIDQLPSEPYLTAIIVGDDPASEIYVSYKEKGCKQVGIKSKVIKKPATSSQEEVEDLIHELNEDPEVDGILLQLPLPEGLDSTRAMLEISPDKDVDGLHYVNIGKLQVGMDGFIPCTPFGVMKIFERGEIDLEGKHAVIIGRSNLVGKPMVRLLERENATVTLCHSRTRDLSGIVKQADVIVAAVGRPEMITKDMVKEGAIVIDVGINRLEKGLVGDVDFEQVKDKADLITPVPGGVGPLTITMLLKNTVKAYKKKHNL